MSLINRLERRFGWLAIPHLTLLLIAGQALLYIAARMPEGIKLDRIRLDPALVMNGEYWRLATFLFDPPNERPIFILFYFLLLYLFGTTLEQQWGTFRFNLFLLIGYLANVGAAFVAWFAITLAPVPLMGAEPLLSNPASNQFLYGTLFLAFARLYPDFIINLFFVLPIRIKWLALLAWVGYTVAFLFGSWMNRLLVLASVLNYLLFFGREHWSEFRHAHRRRSFRAKASRTTKAPKHACRVCGLSSDDSPKTLFRYCSKCAGQCCYCPDHIRDHEHIASDATTAP